MQFISFLLLVAPHGRDVRMDARWIKFRMHATRYPIRRIFSEAESVNKYLDTFFFSHRLVAALPYRSVLRTHARVQIIRSNRYACDRPRGIALAFCTIQSFAFMKILYEF